jgi:integrase
MGSLRIALDENGLDVPRLRRLASDDAEPNVSVLAEFALYLSRPIQSPQRRKSGGGCDPATVGRYCLLIATKLIPRLQDPVAKVTDDAWEDALEELLDEDSFYQLRRYSERPSSSSQTNSRPLVKALRHWLRFLSLQQFTSIPNKSQENPTEFGDDQRTAGAASKETTNAADRLRLAKLEKRLPVLGLVNVDAALITVDEYLKALRRLGEWKGINNLHDREAARIALILGYRCGLRRSETAWLRICDFDRIDYLHIRPTEMRPLKTSNANRDLPLSLLVPEEELIQIRKRVSQVRSQARQKKIPPDQAYLFSESREPGKRMNFNTRLVRKIYKAFKGDRSRKWDPIDSDFRYHRLRHSCATILLLKLWPELHKIARHVLKQDATKTIDWIEGRGSGSFRNKLFGNMHVTEADLQAIALLMGHGSAATSLANYLHVLDWYEMPNSWD